MKSLVIIGVLAVSGHVFADWEHPHYSFRCHESKGIDIFGIHKDSTVTILSEICKNRVITQENEVFHIGYDCAVNVNKTEETPSAYEVDISVNDPKFDGNTTTTPKNPTTPITTPVFSGGHYEHKFKIRCLNIPDAGVNKTVAHVFQGGPHELPHNEKEVFPVEMHFKATKNTDAPDISEIYIGDEFYMFLNYTGVSKYKVIPKSCTAYAGTVGPGDSSEKVLLWDETKNAKGCTEHTELLASIEEYENQSKIIAAKMYGFKFKDRNYITIACEVGVFPETSTKGICTNTSERRKRDTRLSRRDFVDTAIQRKNVVGNLRVVDHPSDYKNMASKIGGSFEWINLSIGILMLSSLFGILK